MSNKISILMSGLPGKMATAAAEKIDKQEDMDLLAFALTGNIPETSVGINYKGIFLKKPNEHNAALNDYSKVMHNLIIVDYSQPDAINNNAELYCKYKIPFVMGTTGGDRSKLEETVKNSEISAVIAPNMAKQIVALQSFMEDYANNNPDSLKGCTLNIVESHQQGKKDTSGTAKAMIGYFNKLGIDFKPENIAMIRENFMQKGMGIPEQYFSGHGWHSYIIRSGKKLDEKIWSLNQKLSEFLRKDGAFSDYFESLPFNTHNSTVQRMSKDGTVGFSLEYDLGNELIISHNVNGRAIYAEGTLDAIRFLDKKFYQEGNKGKVYSMIDVLKEGK